MGLIRSRIGQRLIYFLLLGIALSFGILSYLIYVRERAIVRLMQEQNSSAEAEIVSEVIRRDMPVEKNFARIKEMVDAHNKFDNVAVAIYRNDGSIYYGRFEMKVPPEVLASGKKGIIRVEHGTYLFSPLLNEKTCRGCHSSKDQLRGVIAVFVSNEGISKEVMGIFKRMGFVIFTLALASVIGVLFITRRMFLDPLAVLTEGANEMGSGNFGHRIHLKTRDELGAFAETFNSMAERIENSHKYLKEAVIRQTRDLHSIARLSTEVFRGDIDLDEIINIFLETITDDLGYEFCTLCLLDKESGELLQEFKRGRAVPLCTPQVHSDKNHPFMKSMLSAEASIKKASELEMQDGPDYVAIIPIISHQRKRCRIVQNCRFEDCPAYDHPDERCWLIECTSCKSPYSRREDKIAGCVRCAAFPIVGVLIAGKTEINPVSILPVEILASEIAAALDNFQLIDRQKHDIKELKRLHDLSMQSLQYLSSADLYSFILSNASSFARTSAATLWLIENGWLQAGSSLQVESFSLPPLLPPDEDFIGRSIQSGRITEVLKSDEAGLLADFMNANGFRYAASVPLKGKEGVVGCITLFRKKDFLLSDSEKALLMLLAGWAASNIGMIRLYEELKGQKEMLKESEEKYRKLIETSNDAIAVIDSRTGLILNINKRTEEMFCATADRILGRDLLDFHPQPERAFYRDIYAEALKKGKTMGKELYVQSADGTLSPVEISASSVELGEARLTQIVFRDITERKEAEDALLESEASYRMLSQNLPGIVYRLFLGKENKMVFFNDMVQKMTGYRPDELVVGGVCCIDKFIYKDDRENVFNTLKFAIMNDEPFQVEYRFIHRSNEVRFFQERGKPVRTLDGKFSHIDGMIFDVTEQKRAEQAMRESEEKFRSLAETTSSGIFISREGLIYANPAIQKMLGADRHYLIGRSFSDFIHKDFSEIGEKLRNMCFFNMAGTAMQNEFKLVAKDKSEKWVELTAKMIDYKGEKATLGTIFDITERKKIEEALREIAQGTISAATGEEALHFIALYLWRIIGFEHILIAEFTDDERKSVRSVSLCLKGKIQEPIEYRLEGTPCQDVAGRSLQCHPRDVQKLYPEDGFLKEHEIESYIGTPLFNSAGKSIGHMAMLDSKPMENPKYAESMLRIFAVRASAELERKKAEEEMKGLIADLKAEKEFSEAMFNSTVSGVMVIDAAGSIIRINQPGAEILEYTPDEITGKNIRDIDPSLKEMLIVDPAMNREIYISLKSGIIKPIGFINSPLLDVEGRSRGIIAVFRDLTELKKLQAEIRKKQHYESMGKVISGVAHEIRNPLFAIQSIGQLLQRDVVSAQHQALIEAMLKETRRMKNLIEELLLYSRPSRLNLSDVELDLLMEEIKNYFVMKGANGTISVNVPPLLKVRADRDKMRQVLLNVTENSLGAASKQIKVTAIKSGESVRITIRDDGEGISPEDIEKVFDPFFTTKKEGTGLGLPICRKIVEEHGGKFEIRSERGSGTEVEITLKG